MHTTRHASASDGDSRATCGAARSDPHTGLQRLAPVGVFVLATIAALHLGRPFLLPVLIAVLLSLLLSPAVSTLERLRLARWLAALLVVIGALATTVGPAAYLAAPARQWIDAGPERLEALRSKLRLIRQPVDAVKGATERVAEIANDAPRPSREVVIARPGSDLLLEHARPLAIGSVSVVILVSFLLASGDLFLRQLIRITPRLADKIRAIEIARSVQDRIGRYFASITLINVGLGVVVAVSMSALGMPTQALLGAVVAVLDFVPDLGSLLALVAVMTFDTVGWMLRPPAVLLVLTTLEGQVVQPIVLGRQPSTPAVAMFLWVPFWGWMRGFGGVAVAVPMRVAVKICAEHLPSWQPLSELPGRD